MPISWKSELMLNQKPADVLAPGVAFDVVQTSDGGAVYLSISTDHAFCMTKEIQATTIGWEHADQSSSLSSKHDGQPVVAKSFAVSQHPRLLTFDVALVISVAGTDHLYFSSNNSPDSEVLSQGLTFAACPFDAQGKTGDGLQIAEVFLMMMPGQQSAAPVQNCFVDILREPGDPLQLVDRYYINTAAPPGNARWYSHGLPIELAAGSISCCLGQRYHDRVPGIYTFGTIAGKKELIYTPQRNVYRPDVAPNSVNLALPAGATSIATSLDKSGCTNLFLAASGSIFLWSADNQGEQATPLQIMAGDSELGLLSDIKGISATAAGGRTQICGLNSQGDIFHMYCPSGTEASPSSWSSPIPLASEAQGYSFYLDSKTGNTVLFADHISNGLLQLSENPVTTSWTERRVLLPPSRYDSFTEYHSFTSHISVSDESGLPRTDMVELELTAAMPVSIYINNMYHVLGPAPPVRVRSDEAGVLTVIQETQNFEATAFTVTVVGGDGSSKDVELIRPMNNLVQTLTSIKTGDDLGKVMIEAGDGTKHPLLTADVSDEAKNSVAQSIANLLQVNKSLPKDGSAKLPTPLTWELQSGSRFFEKVDYPTTWGVSFKEGEVRYVEGDEAMLLLVSDSKKRRRLANAPGPITLGDIGSTIRAKAGAFFRWCKRIWHKVTTFITREIDGIMHFICTIGEKIYQVALDCYHAVAGALEFVFTQIKVFFQDLVRWLGFVFNWRDILRAHSVLKNIVTQYSENMIAELDNIEERVEEAFIGLEDKLNVLTDITDDGETIGTQVEMAHRLPGSDLPQAKWGLYHAVNGAGVARMSRYGAPPLADSVADDVKAAVEVLIKAAENEAEYIKTTIDQLKTQVIDSLAAQRPAEAMKKVLGILGVLFLKSARNVIVALVDIVKLVLRGFIDSLNAKIKIPVLSCIYKRITDGSDLTVLDLFCLIGATAATAVYKVIARKAPYPDNPHTDAIIQAKSWDALRAAMCAPTTSFHETPAAGRHRHHGRHHHRHSRHHHHHIKHHRHGHTPAHPTHKNVNGSEDSEERPSAESLDSWTMAQGFTNIAGPVGGIFILYTSKWPRTFLVRSLTLAAYVLFVCPNFVPNLRDDGDWMTKVNHCSTLLCIGKTALDNLFWYDMPIMESGSPIIECVLNVLWFVPSCGWLHAARNKKEGAKVSDAISFAGAFMGLGYAVGAGMMAKRWLPDVQILGDLTVVGCTGSYCLLSEAFACGLLMGK